MCPRVNGCRTFRCFWFLGFTGFKRISKRSAAQKDGVRAEAALRDAAGRRLRVGVDLRKLGAHSRQLATRIRQCGRDAAALAGDGGVSATLRAGGRARRRDARRRGSLREHGGHIVLTNGPERSRVQLAAARLRPRPWKGGGSAGGDPNPSKALEASRRFWRTMLLVDDDENKIPALAREHGGVMGACGSACEGAGARPSAAVPGGATSGAASSARGADILEARGWRRAGHRHQAWDVLPGSPTSRRDNSVERTWRRDRPRGGRDRPGPSDLGGGCLLRRGQVGPDEGASPSRRISTRPQPTVRKMLLRDDGSVQVAYKTAHAWMKRLGADRR